MYFGGATNYTLTQLLASGGGGGGGGYEILCGDTKIIV